MPNITNSRSATMAISTFHHVSIAFHRYIVAMIDPTAGQIATIHLPIIISPFYHLMREGRLASTLPLSAVNKGMSYCVAATTAKIASTMYAKMAATTFTIPFSIAFPIMFLTILPKPRMARPKPWAACGGVASATVRPRATSQCSFVSRHHSNYIAEVNTSL